MKTYEKVLNLTMALELHNINPKDFAIVLTKSELEEFDKSMPMPKLPSQKNEPKMINGMLIHPVPDPVTPFDFESMPMLCVVRHKRYRKECLVVGKATTYVVLPDINANNEVKYSELAEDYEWRPAYGIIISTTGEYKPSSMHDWKPCTKESLK